MSMHEQTKTHVDGLSSTAAVLKAVVWSPVHEMVIEDIDVRNVDHKN